MTFVGIDIGSSAVKSAVFNAYGEQLRVVRIECPSAGEFDPERWWSAAQLALSQVGDDSVEAIGICGRGGTNVLLDSGGNVCGPSWDSNRAHDFARTLRSDNPGITPQALGLLAKATLWRDQGHEVAAVCTAKDFAVYRLTGELVADDASGAAPSDAEPSLLQRAQTPWDRAGFVRDVPGLRSGVPVAVGWHDGAAATFGAGAARAGAAPVTFGTNAVYRVVTTAIPPTLRKYWDLTPGLTVTGGDILGAGRTHSWASSLFAGETPSSSPAGCGGVLFLPQAHGRISPDVRLDARAAWWGIDADTTPSDLLRAVIEGVALALRQVCDWLGGHGLVGSKVFATGGGARHALQSQVLADILQQPVTVAAFEEGCRGAALLGGIAAGLLTLEEARLMPAGATIYEPDVSLAGLYDAAFARWLELQRAVDGVST